MSGKPTPIKGERGGVPEGLTQEGEKIPEIGILKAKKIRKRHFHLLVTKNTSKER